MSQFEDYFGSHADLAKQLIWEQTLYQVFALFEDAERRMRNDEVRQSFERKDGWWRKNRHEINGIDRRIPEETAISEALWRQMKIAKDELILNADDPNLEGIDDLEFHIEVPRAEFTGVGRRSKPTDFQFYRRGLKNLDLRIEAKVLRSEADIDRNYLSLNGLGRFSDPDEPYSSDLIGGMVAYTVSRSHLEWTKSLNSRMLVAKPALKTSYYAVSERPNPILFSSVKFDSASVETRDELLVFHMVLEMESDPSAR